MPMKILMPTAEPTICDDVLSGLVTAVKEDPTGVVASVKARVAASRTDANNCMMGGWTA